MGHNRPNYVSREISNPSSVTVYSNDIVVHRPAGIGNPGGSPRGEISNFSNNSRRRLAFVASNTSIKFVAMVTLTYPLEFPGDGREVKRHFANFMKALRRKLGKMSYLWFLEFQKRGAPHYHILIDRPRKVSKDFKMWVSRSWYRIVGSNDDKHLRAGTRTENVRKGESLSRYAVKYAIKMRQKAVPEQYRNVGRFWSHSPNVKPQPLYEVGIETNEQLAESLQTWDYFRPDRIGYKVLYNSAGSFMDWLIKNGKIETGVL